MSNAPSALKEKILLAGFSQNGAKKYASAIIDTASAVLWRPKVV
jgi:hypothetical protein